MIDIQILPNGDMQVTATGAVREDMQHYMAEDVRRGR